MQKRYYYKKLIYVFYILKMNEEILVLSHIGIDKHKFYNHKNPILIVDVYINKALISNKVSLGRKHFKCFVDYKDDYYKMKLLCLILPKMSRYVKSFDETKYVYFLIKDDELVKRWNKIW